MSTQAKLGHNYLVAVDQSKCAEEAFNSVIKAMDHDVDTLCVLSVAEDVSPTIGAPPYSDVSYIVAANREIEAAARKLLKQYGEKAKKANVDCTLLLGHGYPRSVIIEEATKRQVDEIWIGRRGMSKLKRVFIGSHSRYVIENAPCTVHVVHSKEKE